MSRSKDRGTQEAADGQSATDRQPNDAGRQDPFGGRADRAGAIRERHGLPQEHGGDGADDDPETERSRPGLASSQGTPGKRRGDWSADPDRNDHGPAEGGAV